jgi:hypothetical protein
MPAARMWKISQQTSPTPSHGDQSALTAIRDIDTAEDINAGLETHCRA